MKCLRAEKNGALYEVPASYNAPFFHVYVMILQMISVLVPRWKNFAEWLRGNLCIPDQEHVDSLIWL